jgi:phospholipase/lecithinase/hemolysin
MKFHNPLKHLIKVLTLLVLTVSATQTYAQFSTIDRIVTFGASLSDTGNSFVWLSRPENQGCGVPQNVPPYDKLDDFLVPEGPYAVGGHHYTNGATWVEGLARYFGLAGNARPAFRNIGGKASNYAVGGARAIANYPCRFNLPEQVGAYLTDLNGSSISPETLIAIEIGGNDIRDALDAAGTGGVPAALARLQSAIESTVENLFVLHSKGARKFLVMTVPDIGTIPAVRAIPGASAPATALTQAFNAGLTAALGDFKSLTGSDVRVLDAYSKFNEVINNASAFGFVNTENACITPKKAPFKCKKPDTYVFWDVIHPTKAIHDIVAQQAIGVVSAP